MEFILAQSLLEPNTGLIFYKTLVFGLLLLLLYRYAWKPITSALSEREETIDSSIKRAERALAEARQIQSQNEKDRREAEQEAQRLIREAREAADRARSEEIEKTRADIRRMKEQAEKEIEREKQSALNELRDEVAALAIQAAEKILQENLDAGRQRRLVDRFIDSLPKN
ncbi:MAG: F0F1 ATP synthase subunit B [Rhodothermales bacterium]